MTPAEPPSDELVPAWLAALVLVLLLAVAGTAGYVIRGRIAAAGTPRTAEDVAVTQAEAAVRAHPADKQGHLDYAFALQQDGQYAEALVEYDSVLKIDPRDTAAMYNKAMVYLQLKQPSKAEAALWSVLDVSKTHVLAAQALGQLYAGRHQYRSLLVAVKPAADAHPDMADLQCLMGSAYENLGRKDLAISRYRLALQYVPDQQEARTGLKRLGVTP